MTSNSNKLADYLKEKRIAAGLTQKAVSDALGYSTPQFISNWERGLASPPLTALAQLVELYGLNSSELIELIMREQEGELRRVLAPTRRKA